MQAYTVVVSPEGYSIFAPGEAVEVAFIVNSLDPPLSLAMLVQEAQEVVSQRPSPPVCEFCTALQELQASVLTDRYVQH